MISRLANRFYFSSFVLTSVAFVSGMKITASAQCFDILKIKWNIFDSIYIRNFSCNFNIKRVDVTCLYMLEPTSLYLSEKALV